MAALEVALKPLFPTLSAGTAEVVVKLAPLVGLHAATGPDPQVDFTAAGADHFRYSIDGACTGVTLVLVYSALVLAYPASRPRRMVGLALGIPALFVANFMRLVALGWVGLNAPTSFESVHRYWAATLLIGLIGLLWFAWVWFVAEAASRAGKRPERASTRLLSWARLRQPAQRALLHAATLSAAVGLLGVLGLAGGGIAAWGRLTFGPQEHIARLFDIAMPAAPPNLALTAYGLQYATLVAVVILFLVAPAAPWRQRILGALLRGAPAVYAVQLGVGLALIFAASIFRLSTNVVIGPFIQALGLPLEIGIPAVIWHRWRAAIADEPPCRVTPISWEGRRGHETLNRVGVHVVGPSNRTHEVLVIVRDGLGSQISSTAIGQITGSGTVFGNTQTPADMPDGATLTWHVQARDTANPALRSPEMRGGRI